MSRVWGRVAFLRYSELSVQLQENSWSHSQHRDRPGWVCNTPGMVKHLMGAKAPNSHLCLQSAKATGGVECPSSALALPGHGWRGIGTNTSPAPAAPPLPGTCD